MHECFIEISFFGMPISIAYVTGAGTSHHHRYQWITLACPPRFIAYSTINKEY